MKGRTWIQKLTSRKLWMAVALFISGVMTATGHEETAETVAGLIMQGAAVLAYIIGEGLVDGIHKNENVDNDAEDIEEYYEDEE